MGNRKHTGASPVDAGGNPPGLPRGWLGCEGGGGVLYKSVMNRFIFWVYFLFGATLLAAAQSNECRLAAYRRQRPWRE